MLPQFHCKIWFLLYDKWSFVNRTASFSSVEGPDYRFSTTSTNHLPAEWRLDIEDNDIALEYDDQLNLVYYPRPFSNITTRFEAGKQFIRSKTCVYIEDNDRKPTLMFCNKRSICQFFQRIQSFNLYIDKYFHK